MLGGLALVMFSGIWLLDHLTEGVRNTPHEPGPWLIGAGLAGVVFGTYSTLAVLGYRVSLSGRVQAPKAVTWLVTALVTIVVMGGVLAILTRK